MKISNSKKKLAEIIHENGGWRDGFEFAAQDGRDRSVWLYNKTPERDAGCSWGAGLGRCAHVVDAAVKLPNWHQTVLSRDEYFFLYQNQGLEDALDEPMVEAAPTIEQLAADYHNRQDYADRKQQEADAAKADAEAKLAELIAAGRAIGLVLSVVGAAPEPELVITDWRDLRVGDEIEMLGDGWNCDNVGKIGVVSRVEGDGYNGDLAVLCDIGEEGSDWGLGFKFIRRPAKGDDNA